MTLGIILAPDTAVTDGTVVNKVWVCCNDGCIWIELTTETGGVKGCGEAVGKIVPLWWIFANSCSSSWRRDPGLCVRIFIFSLLGLIVSDPTGPPGVGLSREQSTC